MIFPGSPAARERADQHMRAALADSVRHVWAAGLTPSRHGAADVESALASLSEHRVSPGVFGAYYEMVLAVQGKRYDEARQLLGEIVERAGQAPALSIAPFTEAALGRDMERFGRLLATGATQPRLLGSPGSEDFSLFEEQVEQALRLIEAAAPELYDELRSLIVLIVGAVPPVGRASDGFGGASSFMLWGAVFLNIGRHRTALETVEGLVHEAAHQFLFAFSRDDALVENDIKDRFASPLRRDPRPMIGVYHATFVCARVHYIFERLLAAGDTLVSETDRHWIEARRADQRRSFNDGLATVLEHGRLTETGARIMDDGRRYMAAAA